MLKFTVKNRATGESQSYQLKQNVIILGRSPKCDVVLNSATVSRHHTQLVVEKSHVEIEDLSSGNGTLLNQEKIPPGQRVSLVSGDSLRIEEFDILIENACLPDNIAKKNPVNVAEESVTNVDKKFETTDPEIVEVKMIKKILGALDNDKRPCLFVNTEPFQNLKIHFDSETAEFFIGRDPECQLAIDSPVVSRKHAKITPKWGSFVITDLESKNKTFLNGEEIEEHSLHDGDEIAFGTIKAIFKNPQEFSLEAISKSIVDEKNQEQTKLTRLMPPKELPSEAAKISTDQPPSPITTPEAPQESKETTTPQSPDDPLTPSEKSENHTKTHVVKKGLLSGLTMTEKLLLFFGFLLLTGLALILNWIL